jgi:hypothetical protein
MAVIGFLGMFEGMSTVEQTLLGCALTTALSRNEHELLGQWSTEACPIENLLSARMPSFSHLPDRFAGRAGMDSLLRVLATGQETTVNICDYVHPVLKGRLDWLPGTRFHDMCSSRRQLVHALLRQMRTKYISSFVRLPDCSLQLRQSWSLKDLDILVICLEQDEHRMRLFFEMLNERQNELPEQVVFVITNYDAAARLNAPMIKKMYAQGRPLFALPYCTEFRNAANEGDFVDLFLRRLFKGERTDRGMLARSFLELRNCVQTMIERVNSL